MSKPYQQLRDRMSPESRARTQGMAKQLRVKCPHRVASRVRSPRSASRAS